jgi:endonuclease/exonuclease/phosphatase family metal-dependent hydrolase
MSTSSNFSNKIFSKYMISISLTSLVIWIIGACGPSKEAAPEPKKPALNVLTYNIHHGNPPTREKGHIVLNTIAETIRKTDPDLVALQELDSVTIRSGKTFQLQVLAEMLGMHYYYGKAIPYEGGGYGVGILSKHPISEARTIKLPNVPDFAGETRVLAIVKVTLPGNKEIYFGSTHLDVTREDNRLLQTTEIATIAGKLKAPVIIGGDFNSTDDKAPMLELFQYFKDASTIKGPTIPVLNPTRRIDYIVYRMANDFEVLSEKVLTADNYGSDHLAFWARLRYK